MHIYTRTGDKGETGMLGNERVSKADERMEAIGTIDELNAMLGTALIFYKGKRLESIKKAQSTLFSIGASLASRKPSDVKGTAEEDVSAMEKEIDEMEAVLPKLTRFILPGGSKSASILHLTRTVCRRAERKVVALQEKEQINARIIIYLNRLSDWLFTLAREENFQANVKEEEWQG